MSSHGSSNTGSKKNTGTASSVKTPANAGVGEDKPRAFDKRGLVGKQFTGMDHPSCSGNIRWPSIYYLPSLLAPPDLASPTDST